MKLTMPTPVCPPLVCHAARLQQLNDVRYQRLVKCEQRARGISQVADWLQQQKAANFFEGPVFGPVCIEINIRAGNRLWPQYVEHACGPQLLNFVCSSRQVHCQLQPVKSTFSAEYFPGCLPVASWLHHNMALASAVVCPCKNVSSSHPQSHPFLVHSHSYCGLCYDVMPAVVNTYLTMLLS
jgi:hypothetical protein